MQKKKKQSYSQTLEEKKDIPDQKNKGNNKEEIDEVSVNTEEGVDEEESNETEESDEK